MLMPKLTIFMNKRLTAILLLGFASGLPLLLTGSTLQAWYTEAGINIVTIGALSLIGVPYALKFMWAPLLDHYTFSRFGKRKSWLLISQALLIAALGVMSFINPSQQPYLMAIIALGAAFFSATQDISITAYQVEVLPEHERGLGVSYYVFAYRIAALLSGGIGLVIAAFIGWKLTYQIMAFIMLLCAIATAYIPTPNEVPTQATTLYQTTRNALFELLNREHIIAIFLFVILYKIGDAFALSLITPFLLHGLGFTLAEVGLVYKSVSFIAMVSGGFVGGVLLLRWSIYRALMVFGIAQAISTLLFVILALSGKQFGLMAFTVFIENFCSGLSTAALFTYMLSLCSPQYSGTQFALLSAVASLGRIFLGPLAGMMVLHLGWPQFFGWSFVFCCPGLLLLLLIKNKVIVHAQNAAV